MSRDSVEKIFLPVESSAVASHAVQLLQTGLLREDHRADTENVGQAEEGDASKKEKDAKDILKFLMVSLSRDREKTTTHLAR